LLTDIRNNPILLTDTYNLSHQRLKVNVDWETSHIYNRKSGMILYGFNETVQSVLNIQITNDMVKEADEYASKMGLIFPKELWLKVVTELNGYVPLLVQSLPEGTWTPAGTPFAQVRNTVKGFGEMVTWFEGIFLHSSFPCGCATEAFELRRYLEVIKDRDKLDDSFLNRIHSFGFRGHRSLEDAYWASTAWNLFLHGTDDFHSMQHTPNAKMGSISALAHKVTQQYDVEYDGYIHTIYATANSGEKIVALVIDTYDAHRFINEYLVPLARYAKDKGVHLVIRPDSGDVLEQVADVYKIVEKNKIDNVTAIIGESMSRQNIKRADFFFNMRRVPLTFVSYGVGGGYYNHINRDTHGFAMKTAYSNGKPRMKFGMDSLKRSIPDKVALIYNENYELMVVREKEWFSLPLGANLYQNIYMFDMRMNTPQIIKSDWDETQKRASEYIKADLQDSIILSEKINNLVKGFEEIYG
jgi:nicotinamide phosphoribosyltransferase